MDTAGTRSSVDNIVARLERLPTSWWQVKARIIVGVATFFDAFDALAIASVLPVIVPLWKLTPPQIGLMISAGFLGQLLGALLFGWIAERYGRMTAMVWSIALFAVMSLACAFAWDYDSLLVLRTIQGIGLGGEVPVAAVFISELAKAQGRGRFVLLYELVFPIGLVAASLTGLWVVPHLGWQYMFVIGALPALLALVLRSLLPGIPALACGARPQCRGRGRDGIDRDTNAEGDRTAAAAGEAGCVHLGQARLLGRSLRLALFAAHVGGVGHLVLGLFRELRAHDLAANVVSNRVQAPA
jgi:MFS family permease